MSKRRYRMYSDEFKRNALELAETSDKSDAQIERDLGMSAGLLSQWRKRYKASEKSTELELSELEQLRAELKRLKRENEVLTQERDILKKAVTIFSKDQ
jgi:transposase